MAQKRQKKNTTKPVKKETELAQIERKQKSQQKLLTALQRREDWMKWLILALIILILLLILFFGYATDWTRGLRKDATTSTDAGLDSLKSSGGGTTSTSGSGSGSTATTPDTGGTGGTSNTSRTSTNTGTNNGSTSTNTGSTTRESSNTSTTTNNTTTNNNTTTPSTPQPNSGLLDLYANASVGDNVSSILDRLPSLVGVSKTCHNEVLIQVCDFTDGNATITTKNLLGTGILTSITKDF
jgi:cytoskeletal protein RodZ